MVDFRPLEAFEYSPSAGPLEALIAPPYDVIDPEMRRRLAAKSPYNIVHLSLPQPEGGLDRYSAAARTLARWMNEKVLVRSEPAFYVIQQEFQMGRGLFTRTGILGEVRLVPWRQGIYPHEITLPKPKEDRLNLYRATRVVPGPAFSLFADKSAELRSILTQVKSAAPYRVCKGPEGSVDTIWKVTGAAVPARISAAFAREDFFIADGHHRYETALAFRDELARMGPLPPAHPANFVLTCAVPFDDEGLVVLPTHRLLALDSPSAARDAIAALRADYDIDQADRLLLRDYDLVRTSVPSPVALYADHAGHLLKIRQVSGDRFSRAAGSVMAAVNTYEVLKMVLPRFYGDVQQAVDGERIAYSHDAELAMCLVDSGQFQAAVILAPLGVRTVAQVASSGNVMPPKSTYFYPKLPTGVVVKPLDPGPG